jgi:divalent metal cation (Fe/Co/Zn/Cd) transporter
VTTHAPHPEGADRVRLERRARRLAAAGVSYNVLEAVVALTASSAVGSAALLAFGLDAVVEVLSGAVVLWQFAHDLPKKREERALRLIGLSFFALAVYVGIDSVSALLAKDHPDTSVPGLVLAAVSLAVMPQLARAQRRTGVALHSASVVAGSAQAQLCSWMSAALLGGLGLDALLGWWWADPVAGLVIASLAAREGRGAWRGQPCC